MRSGAFLVTALALFAVSPGSARGATPSSPDKQGQSAAAAPAAGSTVSDEPSYPEERPAADHGQIEALLADDYELVTLDRGLVTVDQWQVHVDVIAWRKMHRELELARGHAPEWEIVATSRTLDVLKDLLQQDWDRLVRDEQALQSHLAALYEAQRRMRSG